MEVEELLLAKGLLQADQLDQAAARRRQKGGRLTDHLLALRLITLEQLDAVLRMMPPPAPTSASETGIPSRTLLRLLLKAMIVSASDTAPKLSESLRLPLGVVEEMLQSAVDQKLVEITGSEAGVAIPILTYSLTEVGREWAQEALEQSRYVGPVPVSLAAYCDQIKRQRITGERVGRTQIEQVFTGLVISEAFVRRLGPAINSGKSILLYGPPGNGKSSIAEKIGSLFSDIIFVPHCIEVEGQIIRVFDPSLHQEVSRPVASGPAGFEIRREQFDRRWVACRRPLVITGGELTLDMLDLRFSPVSNFYEAPLHLKALGGIFLIDDFGRQLVEPRQLLNRWIIPLEDGIDYLKLHTGKTFSIPFDELVVFSTNLEPQDLMDPAFLRRIPYKLEIGAPTPEEYRRIFEATVTRHGLEFSEPLYESIVRWLHLEGGHPLACYQPNFIVEQVLSAARFEGVDPRFEEKYIADALANLYTRRAHEARDGNPTGSPRSRPGEHHAQELGDAAA
jgi:hypothetical protein